MKKFLICFLIVLSCLGINLIYYVFWGQHKSAEQLYNGKELNLYECVSIYQMHTALWLFAWPISPAAANEVFLMQFTNETDTLVHTCKWIKNTLLSKRVVETMRSLHPGESRRLTWNGNISYGLNDKEHQAAMALNPCVISREKIERQEFFVIRVNNTWPIWSETHIKIYKDFEIILNEGLFRYLQDKKIIHSFVDEYRYPCKYFL